MSAQKAAYGLRLASLDVSSGSCHLKSIQPYRYTRPKDGFDLPRWEIRLGTGLISA